jgi:hypothetical protein
MTVCYTTKVYETYTVRKQIGKQRGRHRTVIRRRLKVYRDHYKRNQGIDIYTHSWFIINTAFEALKKELYFDERRTRQLVNAFNKIKFMSIWRNLPLDRKKEIIESVPSDKMFNFEDKIVSAKKIINKALLYTA